MDVIVAGNAAVTSPRARAHRLTHQLRALIERQIEEGRLKPGDRLLPERELAYQYGASRNVVRAALAELGKAGRITRHVGRGTLVAGDAASREGVEGLKLADVSPAEALEFRLGFEPGLAEGMVLHGSENDVQSIVACVDQGDAARRWEDWEHWDRKFHQRLVLATHNRLAIAVYDVVTGIRHKRPWLRLKQGTSNPEKWRQYQREHRAIADALAARDVNTLASAIRSHLQKVRMRMLASG
jgi:DNA-binding FadR family transcriptional regulator